MATKKSSTAKKPSTSASKALDKQKEIVRRWADEVFNKHNLAFMDKGYDDDYINFNPYPGQGDTLPPFRDLMAEFLAAYPDMYVTIDELIADGDTVISIGTFNGTNSGPFMGNPPTGLRITSRRVDVFRFKGSKIVERWGTGNDIPKLRVVNAAQPLKPVAAAAGARGVGYQLAEEVFANKNLTAVDELVDDNAEDTAKSTLAVLLSSAAFPDARVAADRQRVAVKGDLVTVPVEVTGAHRGRFLNVEATGARVQAGHRLNVRVVNGRVVEGSFDVDLANIAKQLGAEEQTFREE